MVNTTEEKKTEEVEKNQLHLLKKVLNEATVKYQEGSI